MQGLGATKSRLRNLLKYADELFSFNEKVAFDLAREPYPHFHVAILTHHAASRQAAMAPYGKMLLTRQQA